MKIFKEFMLDATVLSPQTLYIPANSEVVDVYSSDRGVCVLALSDPNEENFQLRTFKICAKDENIYIDTVKYIGSFEGRAGKRFLLEIVRGD